MSDLPHDGVWCRLGISPIHGIGVFAVRPIPAGTDLFANDTGSVVWIGVARVEALPPGSPLRKFYEDFAIRRGDRWGCPINFNMMGVGWYLNQPSPGESANVAATAQCAMIAARDIAENEELTVVYSTFSA